MIDLHGNCKGIVAGYGTDTPSRQKERQIQLFRRIDRTAKQHFANPVPAVANNLRQPHEHILWMCASAMPAALLQQNGGV